MGAEGLFGKRMVNTGRGERENERTIYELSTQKGIFVTDHSIGLIFDLKQTHFLSLNSLSCVIEWFYSEDTVEDCVLMFADCLSVI